MDSDNGNEIREPQTSLPLESQGLALDERERRRYPRTEQSLQVTFVYEGREFRAQTVDVSRSGALFASTLAPELGTELLLLLQDPQNPRLQAHVKATVVRHAPMRGRRKLFAVIFGDAVSRDPAALGRFLNQVLGIANGLIRVDQDKAGGKIFTFSFAPIHREGEERLKALQSSLFRNLEEMEEADSILSSFGNKPGGTDSDAPPAPSSPTPKKSDRKSKAQPKSDGLMGLESVLGLDSQAPSLDAQASFPEGDEASPGNSPTQPSPEPLHQKGQSRSPADKAATKETVPASAKAGEIGAPKASKSGFFSSLFGSKGKKGGNLITPEPVPAIVAQDTDVSLTFMVGKDRRSATAVRLYCAGMKCTTTGDLPQLYSTVSIQVPVPLRRKPPYIELYGDVTRLKVDELGEGGIFEVRFSMRTNKNELEAYRQLLSHLIQKDT